MSDNFTITVKGLDQIQARFDQLPAKIQAALKTTMDGIGLDFIDYIRSRKLSGSPIHRISGALQDSFTSKTSLSGDDASVTISSSSPYAAYHEFGFRGTESVSAHSRLGHPVKAFTRTVNYAGHPYFQPAITEYEPEIYARIDAAVDKAIKS